MDDFRIFPSFPQEGNGHRMNTCMRFWMPTHDYRAFSSSPETVPISGPFFCQIFYIAREIRNVEIKYIERNEVRETDKYKLHTLKKKVYEDILSQMSKIYETKNKHLIFQLQKNVKIAITSTENLTQLSTKFMIINVEDKGIV